MSKKEHREPNFPMSLGEYQKSLDEHQKNLDEYQKNLDEYKKKYGPLSPTPEEVVENNKQFIKILEDLIKSADKKVEQEQEKGDFFDDLRKAKWYLDKFLEKIEDETK